MNEPTDLVWRQLHWPTPLPTDHALNLIGRLAADPLRQPILFEARARAGQVSHAIGTAAHQVREISDVIESMIPGATLSAAADRAPFSATARVRLTRPTLSLQTDRAAETARAVLAALASAHFRDEEAVLQLAIGRGIAPRLHSAKAVDPTQPWLSVLAHGALPPSTELAKVMRDKAGTIGLHVIVRVGIRAMSEGRRTAIGRGILAALRTVQAPGTRLDFLKDRSPLDQLPARGSLRLSALETLLLIGWPLEGTDLPGMPSPHPKLLRLTASDIEKTRIFATTNAPGEAKPVGIAIEDALFHTVVLGPTGAGKSTALLNLIVADLKAGRSVAVIDPKNDLITDTLQRIPSSRAGDVVVLDPTQPLPVGLNPLHVPGTSSELIADGILGVFRDLFPSAFGPRTSDVLHASLLTLAHHPDATLVWLPRLLTDVRFRRRLTSGLDDPDGLGSFWQQYESLSERQQAQHIGPVLSRLRQFLLRPTIRRVLEQPEPRFDLADLFRSPKVLLVPMNTGLLGNEAARLLGSLLVSQLWHLTLARTETPASERTPVSIYIDEAQEFLRLGGDLSDALARSRSLGVGWHVAHQYRAQMPPEMRAALDANARNKLIFSLGAEDARAMAAMAPELTAEDFMALPKHTVYANLLRAGQSLGWISAATLPPPPVSSDPVEILSRSQARYGRQPETPTDDAAETSVPGSPGPSDPPASPIGRKRRTS